MTRVVQHPVIVAKSLNLSVVYETVSDITSAYYVKCSNTFGLSSRYIKLQKKNTLKNKSAREDALRTKRYGCKETHSLRNHDWAVYLAAVCSP